MDPLNGRQLRNAIAGKLAVRLVIDTFGSVYDEDTVTVACSSEGTRVVFFGTMGFDPERYTDEDPVFGRYWDGTVGLYPVQGINYD